MKIENTPIMDLESLRLLETKIGRILELHEEVRREKDALVRQLKEREEQFAQLAGQVKQYEHERRELKTRLEKIMSRLNGVDVS